MLQNWIQLSINNPGEIKEAISNYLFELGAMGVVENENRLDAYFEQDDSQLQLTEFINKYMQELDDLGFDTSGCTITTDKIANRDWNSEWKKSYKSVQITDNILIKPSWEPMPENPPKCLIEIDPAMAFGTGTHETTKLILHLLEKNLRPTENILDVGTGTGILAIAALKLGAEKVLAFDIDPLATEATIENAEKNNVSDRLNVFTGILSNVEKSSFDTIMANVNRTEILKMLPFITAYMGQKTNLFLSGILTLERDLLTGAVKEQNLNIIEILEMGEWIAIHATR